MSKSPPTSGTMDTIFNPFPGLRPFSLEESDLFFGREGQSRSVLESLQAHRFVAVVGASGSGKSSLIYCGVVPELLKTSKAEWKRITTRPGSDPLHNLTEALKKELPGVKHMEALIEGTIGMEDWMVKNNLQGTRMLIIVDQFEELFRYAKGKSRKQDDAGRNRFVDLIYQGCNSTRIQLHVVVTMRSDFIGECSVYQNLTDLINRSNYLIPQMTRDDFRKAIEGPAEKGGALIDPALVDQLLDEIGENTDQLPVLQHSLMRTWEYWMLQNDPEKPIVVGDYEAIGRMEKALSDHANEAFDELNEDQRHLCESMFKTLTEKGGDNRGVRRPSSIARIAGIAVCEPEEIIQVAEVFRSKGRTFLTPYQPVALDKDTVLDISHESLMRIWDRLRLWVDEEDASVQMYNRLSASSRLYQEGRAGLWRPPDLQLALNWREKQQPTVTWAVQYNPAFERAIEFLETSEREFRKEEENKIRLQRRRLRITRTFALVLGGIAIIAMGLFLWTRDLQNQAEAEYERAEQNRLEAEAQRVAADSAARVAVRQSEIADSAAREAERQRIAAEDAAAEATRQSKIAERRRLEAEAASNLAEDRRKEAEVNLQRAIEQEQIANENAAEAKKRRMLSIAKSMAVKSQQIDDDDDLKGLLALQAYRYNKEYGGPMHESDIYAGLYDARKALLGEQYNVYGGHTQSVNSIVFKPNSTIFYTAGSDGRILQYSLADSSKSYDIISENAALVTTLAIGHRGEWLVAGTDQQGLLIYHLGRPSAIPERISTHGNKIREVVFMPGEDAIFTIGIDKRILKRNLPNGDSVLFSESDYRYNDIDVSPDGMKLAAADRSGNIFIFNTGDPGDPFVISGPAINPTFSLDFSPDGTYLAAGDLRGNVRIFRTSDFSLYASLRGNKARINDVRFSPNSNYIATSGYDGKVLLWEMADLNNSPLEMEDNRGFVFTLDFSPDERYLISGSSEASRLIARPVRADLLLDNFCGLLERNFTREEWDAYVGSDIDYVTTCPQPLTAK
jgi:hypothetical protein